MRIDSMIMAVIFSLLLALPGPAAAEGTEAASSVLHGTWSAGTGANLTFSFPAVYTVDLESDGTTDIHGTYLVEGRNVVFRAISAPGPLACAGEHGAYRFDLQGQQLSLVVVRDQCARRSELLTTVWTKRP